MITRVILPTKGIPRQLLLGAGCRIKKNTLAPALQCLGGIRLASVGCGGLQYDTLVEMQEKACRKYGGRPFLGIRPHGSSDAPFQYITYQEFEDQVNRARVVMRDAGIRKSDKVAVISSNRIEWAVSAYAAFSLGAVYVPMYQQQRLKECEYILSDSGAKLLLVSNERIYDKTKDFTRLPNLKEVWCFEVDYPSRLKVVDKTQYIPSTAVDPNDVSTLIYTSGTTGTPKGVELTHRNLTSDVKGMSAVVPDDAIPVARSVAFLPWAHCFGKTCELHNALQRGAQVAIVEDLAALPAALTEVRPTMLYSVPTLFKRVYDKIQEKISKESPLKKSLIRRALSVSEARRLQLQEGASPGLILQLQFRVLEKLVLQKFMAPLGGELRSSFVGGSAVPIQVANFFENVGVAICEGYGLTETSPLICVNPMNTRIRRVGTVGQLIGDADVRIIRGEQEVAEGEEGEIWVDGPFVFKGYHNRPEETAETFANLNGRRYFKTGDLGRFVKGGLDIPLLQITGRVKELYKLENGKYVVPALVEKALHETEVVQQILVYGDNRPHNIAIMVPNWDLLSNYAKQHHPELSVEATQDEIGKLSSIHNYVDSEVVRACKDRIKKYEVPSKTLLIKEPFTVDNELLTQKLSIKRHNVVKKYEKEIDALYASLSKALVA